MLIVCEGAKTEPNYLHGFRRAKRLSPKLLEIVPGSQCGSNPKNIVEDARARKRAGKRENLPYDEIWCVFDRDEHERFAEALRQADANHMRVALSNPCFELWFLLHYKYHSAPIERRGAIRELKQYLPTYSKSAHTYEELLDKQQMAVANAERLRKHHEHTPNERRANPSTNVHELVRFLNSLPSATVDPP